MKSEPIAAELEAHAAEALKALLEQTSAVKIRELKPAHLARGRSGELIAYLDVYGHSHTLACEVNLDASPGKVRASLKKLRSCAARLSGEAIPVLIAPYLSPEAQALCKASHAGFLDLEGNARIAFGEFFIGRRSLHQQRTAA